MFKRLDLSQHTGRVFVVGDIHGCFSKLEENLAELGFDWETDVLLSVGDLVDRGPESDRALEYLNRPNFHAIAGNHEQMTVEAGGTSWHTSNGGKWFKKLAFTTRKVPTQAEFVKAFRELPVAIEVILPSGRRIGLLHACSPTNDWADIEKNAVNWSENIMWNREPLRIAQTAHMHEREPTNIQNIDHVYYGHTPLKEAFHYGNQSWIDTGAVFSDGYFTIIEER